MNPSGHAGDVYGHQVKCFARAVMNELLCLLPLGFIYFHVRSEMN